MHLTPSASPLQRRSSGVLVAGLVAISVAACGSSAAPPAPQASATSSASSNSAPTAKSGKDHAAGLIESVSGTTASVQKRDGTVTVGFSASTKVWETDPAAVTDVTVGSCVSVRPEHGGAPGPNGSLTAAVVQIVPAKNSGCFVSAQPSTASAPASGSPGPTGPVRGTVSSIGGNSLIINASGAPTPTTVALASNTTYAKRVPANIQAIAQGKCITARGTTDSSGTLQADMIALHPADNGKCPGSRR
ncbi:hypothetical protein MANY_39800 [Mycolicibacterium anyangense]|uniref:DUF5666 domain-containing protein n=1 Tax=Mycolicibacterium anyangense TaxID=1431246 RepID=A0A6N4WE24_9MYCO|nr:DUF5666 domain-containing protein [Mycolicibacterium anyangense]BBZ78643.1 hypothetical protein MANY_39800 [Mycolicibacterium anyangense]